MYAVYHGPDGLRQIAHRTNRLAGILALGLRRSGIELVHEHFFDTVCARVPGRADKVMAMALADGINLRRVDDDTVAVSLDQTTDRAVIERVWHAFGVEADLDELERVDLDPRPPEAVRVSPPLVHPVFEAFHAETELVRYMRMLVNRDIALDRSMIPLGSCTMKLNAAIEMEPVSWPGFADIHPFAPPQQTRGYQVLFQQLEQWLSDITGFAEITPYKGGWCGNDVWPKIFNANIRRELRNMAQGVCVFKTTTSSKAALVEGFDA